MYVLLASVIYTLYSICVALGELAAYEMYKLTIDWSPSQHLGYDKLSLDSAKLAQVQQRASRAVVYKSGARKS